MMRKSHGMWRAGRGARRRASTADTRPASKRHRGYASMPANQAASATSRMARMASSVAMAASRFSGVSMAAAW